MGGGGGGGSVAGGGRGGSGGSGGGGGWFGSGGGGGGADEDTHPLDFELMLIEDQPPRVEGGVSISIGDFDRDGAASVVSSRVKPPDTKPVLPLAPDADEAGSDGTVAGSAAVKVDQPPPTAGVEDPDETVAHPPVFFGSTALADAHPPADPEEPAVALMGTGAHPPLFVVEVGSGATETAAHPDLRSWVAPPATGATSVVDGAEVDVVGLESLTPAAAASFRISFSSRFRSFSFRLSISVLRR